MARYIDADLLIKNIVQIKDLRTLSTKTIGEAISNTPTADVVEVVRCKDCKHRRESVYRSYCLPVFGLKRITDLNSFCSYGERK